MAIFLRDVEVSETLSMDQMIEKIESMQSYYGNGKPLICQEERSYPVAECWQLWAAAYFTRAF
ncbi:MAG: hypothetical protein CM1200mP15_06950 [Dehalococcoidia bacterium]|nr:MAG: hypothetical protein CM1200mP15_06950 [Dehalococcoidia bacterium]